MLFKALATVQSDVTMMQETGINWSITPRKHSWNSRVEQVLEGSQVKTALGFNQRDAVRYRRQWGGTAIMSHGKVAHFVMGMGSDPTKLGRWTWSRYRGKNGVTLRCVSIYRPCYNKTGALSVYNQHKNYLQQQNDDRCPRTAFLQDLEKDITSWLTTGDQLIIGGDINTDIFDDEIQAFLQRCNLHHIIFDKHDRVNAPPTYYRENNNDQAPTGRLIDGIWATPGIQATRCGYLEPLTIPGDHAFMWADISYETALGHNPPEPKCPKGRRLQLWNKRCVNKYLDSYERMLRETRLQQRQNKLNQSLRPAQPLTKAQEREADAIDELKTHLQNKAEKQCRKRKMGAIDFSPATELPKLQAIFWKLAIQRRSGRPVSSTLWKKKKKAAQITERTSTLSISDMKARRKQALQTYHSICKKHIEERKTFLETLSAKTRKRLLKREEQRRLGQAAKRITGKLESKSVTQIVHNGIEIYSKPAIERTFHKINYAKIRASDDTPFLQYPLYQAFGEKNDTNLTHKVLNGTYTAPPATDRYAKRLLKALQRPNLPQDITPYEPRRQITLADHIKGWKKAKERTSAGISGLHFGMYKAHTQRPHLAQLDCDIRNFAFTTGFSYNRWKKGLDVQLLKRSKDFRADKQRTILLLEADFNMNNKVLGADAMRAGERSKVFQNDNYGGRHNMSANEIALNSQLTYNSTWLRRGRMVIMSNDAKGCYDRIAHVVLDLAMQRLGIPAPALRSMITTIQEMEHHIRTAYGESETHYGRKAGDLPPQGILQGNGCGPAGWYSISTQMIQVMKEEGYGLNDLTLISQKAVQLACFAFVDDTDLIHACHDRSKSNETVLAEAQNALTLWEGMLRATGGDLAPEKSYWYLVDVIRKDGKWTYAKPNEQPWDMFLKQGSFQVKRLHVSQAQEALGIQARPDGKMSDEFAYLKGKVKKWCEGIRTKRIHKNEAWYCLNATIMKTIEYPLVATCFTDKQCKSLISPLLVTTLPLTGIQRHMPRALVHGTHEVRGQQLYNPIHIQLIEHLHAIMKHHHRDTPTKQLIDENMELVQIHCGASTPFWDLQYETWERLVPECWMKCTWKALSHSPLSLRGPTISMPPLRHHDSAIMDAFVANGYQAEQLILLNDCRLHLRVTYISEIATANGKTIDREAWNGHNSQHIQQPHWINTYKPPPAAWSLWQQAIRSCFMYPTSGHLHLRQQLGNWKLPSDNRWIWWSSTTTDDIFEQSTSKQWYRWTRHPQQNSQYTRYHARHPLPHDRDLPHERTRIQVRITRNQRYVYVLHDSTHDPHVPPQQMQYLYEVLQADNTSSHWATQHIKHKDEGATIAAAIQNKQALAVSDGSLKLGTGTAGFVIEGPSSYQHLTGANKVPGPIKEGDSHRCEIAGIFSIVKVTDAICKLHNITSGEMEVACDNSQALKVFDPDYKPHPKHLNFDLVAATWSAIQRSPISWTGTHVHGHQDKHQSVLTLPRKSQLNVDMDTHAKLFWQHLLHSDPEATLRSPLSHSIDGEGWQLWTGDIKITHPTRDILYRLLQNPVTQSYWSRHSYSSPQGLQNIDFQSTQKLMKSLPFSRRKWITKHASGECGVGTTLLKWNQQDDDVCPRCNLQETTQHVYKCNGCSATTQWQSSITDLQTYMTESHTDPDISTVIIDGLNLWRNNGDINPDHYENHVRPALLMQQEIGWRGLLEGSMASQWKSIQQNHYDRLRLRKSSNKWAHGLLKSLHNLGWKQWDHRNDIKHRRLQPRQQRAERALNEEIVNEYMQGTRTLLPGDRARFRQTLNVLLEKPLQFKQSWLANIVIARQRRLRKLHHNNDIQSVTPRQSKLLRWLQTNRPS